MTLTQQGLSRRSRYRWPDDDDLGGRIYEALTSAEVADLTADELRAAIESSGTVMRDVDNGLLSVFDSCAMELEDEPDEPDDEKASAKVPMIGPYTAGQALTW